MYEVPVDEPLERVMVPESPRQEPAKIPRKKSMKKKLRTLEEYEDDDSRMPRNTGLI